MEKIKKFFKLTCIALLVAVISVSGLFYISMDGSPITKIQTKISAKKYIEKYYPDCYVKNVGYNFKTDDYFAFIEKSGSMDTSFYLYADESGKITSDSYVTDVKNGYNTRTRIKTEYNSQLEAALSRDNIDFAVHILYGDYIDSSYIELQTDKNIVHGIPDEEIVVDKVYNHKEISYKYGKVVLYVIDEDVSIERTCEILLDVKEKLAENDLGFYAIDFVLLEPINEDNTWNNERKQININTFMYTDIYEDGLSERVQTAHELLTEYYRQQDAALGIVK